MGSSKSKGRRNQRSHKSSSGPTPPRSSTVAAQPAPKVRGGWLTAMLIFIAIHAIITAVLLISYQKNADVMKPIVWSGAIVAALLEIGSAVAMWFWKKWGLYLFVATTLAAIGFGMVVFYPAMAVAFHGIIPLGLLGMILTNQKKLPLFE